MHRDSAQHDSRADVSPTASGNMLPESPYFQFSGSPGHTFALAQDSKRHYMGYWTAALNGESPACPTEEEHVRLCRPPDHYVYVVKTPKTQRQTSYATQRAVASWYDSTETPQQKTKDKTKDKKGERQSSQNSVMVQREQKTQANGSPHKPQRPRPKKRKT
ncbi:hypothetical protein E4U31_004490 [Claviceps sp. LM219 group G6]|nr:hypothetical protein E4U31_004490 [Claviceps sp. LM219 group G6]KAG6106430.1 hypothetical protein E4U14_004600 [Claviceps sp. LM454 group G7]